MKMRRPLDSRDQDSGHRLGWRPTLVALAGFGILLAACSSSPAATQGSTGTTQAPDAYTHADETAHAGSLTGAGSTFDQPFFTRAFYEYNQLNHGVTVNYASIGSGGGIKQFQANTVNFGASDVPMNSSEIAAATGGTVLQVPVALGGEAISYNLQGVAGGMKMTGPVLAEIYLGKITNWDDPAIKALNPGVPLPNQAITVVHRSDGSGTTYIFTNYLSTVSPTWSSGPGTGKSISWPVGVGGKGNEGVAGLVKDTPGSIGYVELAYALQSGFTYCQMKNHDGDYVSPSLSTVAADAAQKPNVTSTDFSIVDLPGASSYPISGYSWLLVYKQQKNLTLGTTLVHVLDWLTHGGQSQAQAIDYVPLPANVQQLARTTLLEVVGPSGQTLLTTS